MVSGVKAAIFYFIIVFVIGFVLGTLRVLVIAPYVGGEVAILMELPAMLAISWIACVWIIYRCAVPNKFAPRFIMGSIAFVLLMAAETCVSMFAFQRTIVQHFESYQSAAAVIGFSAQVVFALFPLIQLWKRHNYAGLP